jgi:hypothetical protein
MYNGIHPKRRGPLTRTRALALAILMTGVLVTGCGGSSGSPTVTAGGSSNAVVSSASRSDTARTSTSTGSTDGPPSALAFAKCMRANGVSSFPDPEPGGGGFDFHASAGVASSPVFKGAQAKCQSLLPGPGGAGGPSSSPQEKAQALAQLRSVAQCMRQHGISSFPDPTLNRPPNVGLGQYSEITDYEGVWLLFPAALDLQSPAWQRAAAACGALAESFTHPHH